MNRAFASLAVIVSLALLNLGGSCASHDKEVPNRIPQLADMVREGNGKLKWTADMDGEFYVYDNNKKTIRYTGDVRRGDEIVIQPESDRIYVAGKIVYDQNLEKHSSHRLYFVAGQAGGSETR